MCSSQSSSILTFTGPPDRFPRLLPQTRHFISHPTSSIYLLPTPFLSLNFSIMAAELPVPVYTVLSDVYPDLVLAAKQG